LLSDEIFLSLKCANTHPKKCYNYSSCFCRWTFEILAHSDIGKEFGSDPRVVTEGPQHLSGCHRNVRFANIAGRHAIVLCLNDNGNSVGLEDPVDRVGDLRGHLFLDLKTTGIDLDNSGQLADADDVPAGQISHMGLAGDRRHMVLAVADELDTF
jgi:hypothetical protein